MSVSKTKIIALVLAGATLAATAGDAFASGRNRYTGRKVHGEYGNNYGYGYGNGYRRHRGIGPGGLAAGAALGIAGAAIGGIAANNYYNGYRAYPYGGYGGNYGYDYMPGRGYYGPY